MDASAGALPAAGTTLGAVSNGPLCIQREELVRVFLFAALVLRIGGGQRICVPLGHRPNVGRLPIPALRSGVEKVGERRDNNHSASPVVAVIHMVGIVGAQWRALL